LTSKRVELRQAVADPTRQWVMAIGVAAAVGYLLGRLMRSGD